MFKTFELTKAMKQRRDSQLIDALNNVRTANLCWHNTNVIQSKIIQREYANHPKDAVHIYAENCKWKPMQSSNVEIN